MKSPKTPNKLVSVFIQTIKSVKAKSPLSPCALHLRPVRSLAITWYKILQIFYFFFLEGTIWSHSVLSPARLNSYTLVKLNTLTDGFILADCTIVLSHHFSTGTTKSLQTAHSRRHQKKELGKVKLCLSPEIITSVTLINWIQHAHDCQPSQSLMLYAKRAAGRRRE